MQAIILIIGLVMVVLWVIGGMSDCGEKCQAAKVKCDYSHEVMREANDFNRDRLMISEAEHGRRNDAIVDSQMACWDRAETLN